MFEEVAHLDVAREIHVAERQFKLLVGIRRVVDGDGAALAAGTYTVLELEDGSSIDPAVLSRLYLYNPCYGGFVVSAEWKQGRLARAEFYVERDSELKLRTRTPLVYEGKEATSFTIPMKEYTTVVLTAPTNP